MRLILVRHGATLNNAQARFTGQCDIELSAAGKQQALALAKRLADERLDGIVSSDLLRARHTAEHIAGLHELPVREDPRLREISLGAWEGSTYEEILARDPQLAVRWQADPVTCAPPGGETLAQLRDRISAALDDWYAEHASATLLWVTHGGVIGVLLCHLLGMDLHRRQQFRRDNASVTELEIGPSFENAHRPSGSLDAVLTRLNDTTHLMGLPHGARVEHRQVL